MVDFSSVLQLMEVTVANLVAWVLEAFEAGACLHDVRVAVKIVMYSEQMLPIIAVLDPFARRGKKS